MIETPQTPTLERSRALLLGVGCAAFVWVLAATPAPGQAAADAVPAAVLEQTAGEYRIGPGDILSMEVFGMPELTRKVRVLRDGRVLLPLVGPLELRGLLLEEAEAAIAGALKEQRLVNEPQVSLFVEEYISRGVTIHGAVKNPGVYQMLGSRTLLEMLGEAGGLSGSEVANGSISIWTLDGEGQRSALQVDINRLINFGDISLDVRLRPGDIVMVPFDRKLRVYVSGAVESPGPVEYNESDGITVLQAITAAGGPNERTKLSKVYVLRSNPDGSQTRTKVDVKKIQRGKAPDVPLENNDVVVVGEWLF